MDDLKPSPNPHWLPFAGAICELEIPDDAPIRVRKTLGPGHFTVWGDPGALLGCVRGVV